MSAEHVGFGRGKIILLGEHAVVHGRPALAVALDRGARACAKWAPAGEPDRLRVPAWGVDTGDGDGAHPDLEAAFAALLREICEGIGARSRSVEVTLASELPSGAGLGGSAASGVAIGEAVHRLAHGLAPDAPVSPSVTIALARAWEQVFHGQSSGLDPELAGRGGCLRFVRGAPSRPIRLGASTHLVVADTGLRASTGALVGRVRAQLELSPVRTTALLDGIASCVERGTDALVAGDARTFGAAMDDDHALLRELGVSHPALEALVERARGAGALGAKLTGSGGGGAVLTLAEDPDHAHAIEAALAPLAAGTFRRELRP